jgi:hypothetical protein
VKGYLMAAAWGAAGVAAASLMVAAVNYVRSKM